MPRDLPELPPLWSDPAPKEHNGGPAMASQGPGRPSIFTWDLRNHIGDLLCDGVPMRVICRTAGMPSRTTVRRWRRADPEFNRMCEMMQREGYIGLAERVVEEVEHIMNKHGAEMARLVFNLRRQQLSRMNPAYFGDRGMKC